MLDGLGGKVDLGSFNVEAHDLALRTRVGVSIVPLSFVEYRDVVSTVENVEAELPFELWRLFGDEMSMDSIGQGEIRRLKSHGTKRSLNYM